MSDTPIEVVEVTAVVTHPNADKLEIVKVLGTQFVSGKGDFVPGDLCVYFPPDMMIPETVGKKLGVANYLKHSIYPGEMTKTRCRIGAICLRGTATFGFGIDIGKAMDVMEELDPALHEVYFRLEIGDEVTETFGGVKYQPPENSGRGDCMRQPGAFHTYTNIQHYYRNESAILAGTRVRVTEKIHGTNSRVGLVQDEGFEFMCGSHRRRIKQADAVGRLSFYWKPLTDDMKEMLEFISRGEDDVIVFGEIYGHGIQKMDYSVPKAAGYRVFDISVNGEYLDWADVRLYCKMFDIPTVPVLHEGPFSPEMIDRYVSGPTTIASPEIIKSKFKGREGIVITPLEEEFSDSMGRRLILKAVSPDYYEAM